MRKMKFEMSNYQGANFMGSDMRKSVFRMSNLNSAKASVRRSPRCRLRSAELKGANFGRSDLRKAKLNAAESDTSIAHRSGPPWRRFKWCGVPSLRKSLTRTSEIRFLIWSTFTPATLRQVLLPDDVDPNILPPNYRPTDGSGFQFGTRSQ